MIHESKGEKQMFENKGLLRIKDKIVKDAEAQAEKMIKAAEEEAQKIFDEKKAEAEKFRKAELDKIELEKKLLEDKMVAQAKLGARKEYVTARENIINDIIDEAVKKVNKDAGYKKFLEKVLSQNKKLLKEPLSIIVAKSDVETVKTALTKLKIKGTVKAGAVEAGMILEDTTGKRIQETLTARLERFKDDIRTNLYHLMEGVKSA